MAASDRTPAFWKRPIPDGDGMAAQVEEQRREHLLLDAHDPVEVNHYVLDPMQKTGLWSKTITAILGGMVLIAAVTWVYQMIYGLGVTGLTRPVMWAVYIVNFVYFIGIGHAGTFISAALRVLGIEFRRPISRAAETVTVFGLGTAALFPIIHLGRSWKFYWLLPYPNERQLWPSFHSPLMWDLMAITTYLTCSIIFAYIALMPDLATARDHTTGWRKKLYTLLAMGWRGTEREWSHTETALNIFSYGIIPVMFSVHTIVSWDFAMALQPGWHSTIFGPYFVVGALFSGVAAVTLVLIILRQSMHLKYFLRPEHFNGMGKFLLILSMSWTYFYFNDYLVPWYGQDPIEKIMSQNLAAFGKNPESILWFLMLFANILLPFATLWSKKIRTSLPAMAIICVFVQIGMYIERFLIVPVGLSHNEIPFSWGYYFLHLPETLITIGAFCLVAFLYILFTRIFPIIPTWEVYEGQMLHSLRRIGRGLVNSKADPE
jgi:molybdopterin-containing oxidoreductase family membrane subunit